MDLVDEVPNDIRKAAIFLMNLKRESFVGSVTFHFNDKAAICTHEWKQFKRVNDEQGGNNKPV